MFEIFFYLAFFSLLASIGAFAWYFVRDRSRRALWVAILSFATSLLLVVAAVVVPWVLSFTGDEQGAGSPVCECPDFAEAANDIAWVGSTPGLVGTPRLEGGRAAVDVSFDPQLVVIRQRLVQGLAALGAEVAEPSQEAGAVRTPLLGSSRLEVRAFWGSDFLRVSVNADANRLDDVDVDLERLRAVFGTVDEPLPVIDTG